MDMIYRINIIKTDKISSGKSCPIYMTRTHRDDPLFTGSAGALARHEREARTGWGIKRAF